MRRALALAMTLALLALPAPALADGDPASDILIGANVFYPYGRPVSAALQKTLNAETAAASTAHFPIKVALIASPIDLGSVPNLFAKPQEYADFLDQEISFVSTKQPLLVVMPNGYGTHDLGSRATAAATSLQRPASGGTDDLARAAIAAVRTFAAAAGHPLEAVTGGSPGAGGGSTALSAVVLALGAVVCAAAVLGLRRRWARTHGRA
jgi:hypothetical protein